MLYNIIFIEFVENKSEKSKIFDGLHLAIKIVIYFKDIREKYFSLLFFKKKTIKSNMKTTKSNL